jgi:PAT family beta-lactamase induction signal transducer AmpG
MSTSDVGLAYGILGVIALLLGGIVGGIAISRGGLKKWLLPMALSLTLPCILYCVLAMTMPQPQGMGLIWINLSIFIEQFGYGFGFTAFMLYLIYFSEGEMKTSHYAFCTAFMALGMMLPGMAAGWLWEKLGEFNILGISSAPQAYINFFWLVVLASIATFIVCLSVKIDPHFGMKNQNED